MTTKQKREYQKSFEEYCKKVSSSEENAREFMIKSGIHDKDGKLSEPYR